MDRVWVGNAAHAPCAVHGPCQHIPGSRSGPEGSGGAFVFFLPQGVHVRSVQEGIFRGCGHILRAGRGDKYIYTAITRAKTEAAVIEYRTAA